MQRIRHLHLANTIPVMLPLLAASSSLSWCLSYRSVSQMPPSPNNFLSSSMLTKEEKLRNSKRRISKRTTTTLCKYYNKELLLTSTTPVVLTSRREIHETSVHHSPADISQNLADEIKDIIHHDKLVLFLTGTPESPRCKFTSLLIDLMDQLKVEYGYFNIATDDEMCEAVKLYSDWPTFPQVYLDGELIGGYDICKEMMLDGSLTKLLKEKQLL